MWPRLVFQGLQLDLGAIPGSEYYDPFWEFFFVKDLFLPYFVKSAGWKNLSLCKKHGSYYLASCIYNSWTHPDSYNHMYRQNHQSFDSISFTVLYLLTSLPPPFSLLNSMVKYTYLISVPLLCFLKFNWQNHTQIQLCSYYLSASLKMNMNGD